MKNLSNYLAYVFLLSIASICRASPSTVVPQPTAPTVISRDGNSRVWERTTYELSKTGQVIAHKQHYTELATGLCYQQNGEWVDSQEQISILPDGSAAATNGEHQAYFPSDIYNGAIELITPDGINLQSRPIGLSYDDGTNTVLIAELTNSVGQLISSNQVIYTNAFVGVAADLLYTYRKGGFEQDVIFRQQPLTPEQYGLTSANTRLQLMTEVFNPPVPAETTSAVNPNDDLQDTTLAFGTMKMTRGRAFLAGTTTLQNTVHQIPVYKSWINLDGRTLLLEQLPYQRISAQLESLPSATVVSSTTSVLRKVSPKRLLPPMRFAKASTNAIQLAKADFELKPGVVMDYIALNSGQTNFTFQGDTTYYVSADCVLSGKTVIEGGTFIKLNGSGLVEIDTTGTLDCQTTPYRPGVFTSYNDDNAGGAIWHIGSGSPNFEDVNSFLEFDSTNSVTLHDLRFSYALFAIYSPALYVNLWDCQCYDVATSVYVYEVGLYNVLLGASPDESSAIASLGLSQIILEGPSLIAENVTADSGYAFIEDDGDAVPALTNCLITSEPMYYSGSSTPTPASNDVVYVLSPSGPVYKVVGGGNYYLTNGSSCHGTGTANIDPTLLAELAQKTTYAPQFYDATNISSFVQLTPQAPRDTNAVPDIGYHYDPMDYLFGGCDLSSNLTVAAGTVIGWFNDHDVNGIADSITLNDGANLSFNGNATQPCYFAQSEMIQEVGSFNWYIDTDAVLGAITFNGSGDTNLVPLLSADFTKWTSDGNANTLHGSGYGAGSFKNSELYNGQISTYNTQNLSFTNCLLFRNLFGFWDTGYAISFTFENCSFYNGGLAYVRYSGAGSSSSLWQIENTVFDGTAFDWYDALNGNPTNTIFNYNAYNTNNLGWASYLYFGAVYGTNEILGTNDLLVTNLNWETNWFGRFYLPANSPLILKGSTNANLLGLYHFTTQTNQTIEGTNTVTIGYHYVATDTNGIPLDSNGDGIPDYIEDPLGNGLPYNGTNWALAILIQPTNQIVMQGTNATLSVTADGVPSLAYQWYFNGNLVANATNSSLNFSNVQTTNDGDYFVVVINNFGAITSSVAELIVFSPSGFIPYDSTGYRYIYTTNDILTSFYTTNYDDSSWEVGQAGFGNNESGSGCPLVANTYWPGYDGSNAWLYIRRHFYIPPGTTNLSLGFTVDNDAQIFLNGFLLTPSLTTNVIAGSVESSNVSQAFYYNQNGWAYVYHDTFNGRSQWLTNYFYHQYCCSNDDLVLNGLSTNIWHTNDNVLAVRVFDNGAVSYYDSRITPEWITTNQSILGVQIISPINQTLLAWTNAMIVATNISPVGSPSIDWVQFFDNGNSVGYAVSNNGLFAVNWIPVTNGTHVLTALAVNANGPSSWSAPVTNYVRGLPTIAITNPIYGQLFQEPPTNIAVNATVDTAIDDGAIVSKVVFYVGTNSVWTNLPGTSYGFTLFTNEGTYSLSARVEDSLGAFGSTSNIVITVEPTNRPPLVYAGPNQTNFFTTNGIPLDGRVSDDGLPLGSVLNIAWTNLSGPSVNFSNSASPITWAYFSIGTNILQLSASDNQFTSYSQVTMIMLSSNRPPVVFPGSGQTIVLPAMTISNPYPLTASNSAILLPAPTAVDYFEPSNNLVLAIHADNGEPFNFELFSSDGTTNEHSVLFGQIDEINMATVRKPIGGFKIGEMFCGDGNASPNGNEDGVVLRVEPDGTLVGTNNWYDNVFNNLHTNGWVVLPDGLEVGSVSCLCVDQTGVWGGDVIVPTTRQAGGYTEGLWRINSAGQATLIANLDKFGITISGVTTVPNDFQRYGPWAGKILLADYGSTWVLAVDTNGFVVPYLMNIGSQDVMVIPDDENFFAADWYGSALDEISASQFQAFAGDILFVDPANLWRVHWNGSTFEIYPVLFNNGVSWEGACFAPAGTPDMPSTGVQMEGVVTDDDEIISPTSNLWTEVSGPSMTFLNPTLTNTLAEFSTNGDYDLLLSAWDGQYTSSSNVIYHVVRNTAPLVNLGTNQTIAVTNLQLVGSVSDDGWPSNYLNVAWSELGGPASVIFTAPTNTIFTSQTNFLNLLITNNIDFPAPGQYLMQLTASDGQASGTASVEITVKEPSLTLSPAYGVASSVNTPFTATATLLNENNAPIVGSNVTFHVQGGPDNGTTETSVTGPNGVAVFTYTNLAATVGRDFIYASYNDPAYGNIYSTTNAKDWGYNIGCGESYTNTLPGIRIPSRDWSPRYADYYVFNGTSNSAIQLTLQQQDAPMLLFVRDPSDKLVATSPPNFNGDFTTTSANFTCMTNGTYVIELTSLYPNFGDFNEHRYIISLLCGDSSATAPDLQVLYSGTNIPSSGAIVFPTTSEGSRTNILLTITNTGLVPFSITNVSIFGDFALSNNIMNGEILPGTATNLGIAYQASSNGPAIGAVVLNADDPNESSYVAYFVGNTFPTNAVPSVQMMSPANGSTFFGQFEPMQIIAAVDPGSAAINSVLYGILTTNGFSEIQSMTFDSGNFTYTYSGSSGDLGGNGDFCLTVLATDVNGQMALANNPVLIHIIPYNNPENPVGPNVPGIGILYNGTNVSDGDTIAFEEAPPSTVGYLVLTVTNTGTYPLAITNIELDGNFSLSNSVIYDSVPVGGSMSLGITYNPAGSGELVGQMSIYNNASLGGVQTIMLVGNEFPTGYVPPSTNLPVATNLQFTVLANTANNTFYPLYFDNQFDTNTLKIVALNTSNADTTGTAAIINNGTAISYTPEPGYRSELQDGVLAPEDGFNYEIADANGNTSWGTISVIVYASDTPNITLSAANYQPTAGNSDPITASLLTSSNVVAVNFYLGNQEIPQAPILDSTGTNYVLNWTAVALGGSSGDKFQATATDKFGQVGVSQPITVNVTLPPGAQPPVAALDSYVGLNDTNGVQVLTNGVTIRDGVLNVYGQAYHPQGDGVTWQLGVYSFDGSTLIRNLVSSNAPVGSTTASNILGTCDLSTLQNGVYQLVLDVTGDYIETNVSVQFILDSNLKIGQFSFSQQDLVIPVNGIPLTVTRTYNSINPVKGDFGYGWTYALANMNVSLDETRQDVSDIDGDVFSERTGGSYDVTLTLPDGHVTTFYYNLPLQTGLGTYNATWTPAPGVTATLSALGETSLETITGTPYWDQEPETPWQEYDFPGFVLKTEDGTRYIINREDLGEHDMLNGGEGAYIKAYGNCYLSEIIDRNGNTITINPNSIVYTAANGATKQIAIQRNSDNLITSITDPNGLGNTNAPPALQYQYDNQDNLIAVEQLVTSATGAYVTNTFSYTNLNFPHYITGIINANGTQVAKNFYDDSGKLIAIQDANGNLTRFVNNLTNNMEVVIDRMTNTTTFVYDSRGNVIIQTNALGQVSTMAYDVNNNKTNDVIYLNGLPYATNSYVYDTTLNVMLSSTDPLGNTSSYAYDSFANLTNSADARGDSTTNVFDGNGNLISTINAMGYTSVNNYNGDLLMSSINPIGTITTNYYDQFNNLANSATLDASGNILSSNSYTYDANNNRLTSTVWRHVNGTWEGDTTANIYDAMNRVIKTINPDGGTNITIYNTTGQQAETIDALGNTNIFAYDNGNRLILTTYPDQTSASSTFDANGNRLTSTDQEGRTTTYVYDVLNRLVETIYPDATTNATVYDDVGRVAQTIDARGTITANDYDVAGRRIAVTYAFGTSIAATNYFSFDADGNQTNFIDADGHSTTNVYDKLNRQIEVDYNDGTKSFTVYDVNGRSIIQTNQDRILTFFTYDGAGRLIGVTNALKQVTKYQYDEAGNEIKQIDALLRTNTYSYDGMGRKLYHTRPDGKYEEFNYDCDGNLTNSQDFGGNIVNNLYDSMNRLTNRYDNNNTLNDSFSYTPTGQRASMSSGLNNDAVVTYAYNSRDRLVQKTVVWLGNKSASAALSYGYDAVGNVTNIASAFANGVNLAYAYDPLNRLTNVLSHGQLAAAYAYDSAGNLTGMLYGNGVTNQYQYDSLNRLTNLVWNYNSSLRAGFLYQLMLGGTRTNLLERVNSSLWVTNQWGYDNLYRLVSETNSLGGLEYAYDAIGNRLNRKSTVSNLAGDNYSYDTNDELLVITNSSGSGDTNGYDSNGNTIVVANSATTNSYNYDGFNRIISANVNGHAIDHISYDGDGNREFKAVKDPATSQDIYTYYLVDDRNPSGYPQVLEEYQGVYGASAALSRAYNYGLDLISQQQFNTNTFVPTALTYYGYDGHGNVRFLMDSNGMLTDTNTFDAFGTLTYHNGTTPNNYLYCGQQFDPDLGLYYNRARYLNTDIGRFWTMDAFEGSNEDPLSLHKYLYAEDNPISNVDPSGRQINDVLAAISIGVIVDRFTALAVLSYEYGVPDAVGFGVLGAIHNEGPLGGGVLGGLEVVFDPKLREEVMYGFYGGEVFAGAKLPDNLESINGDLGIFKYESFYFEAWYWNVPDLNPGWFGLGGISVGNAFAAGEAEAGGTKAVLFGVSNDKALDLFAIGGNAKTLIGPTQISKNAMIASVGTMEAGSSLVMNSTVNFKGFGSLADSILNGGLVAFWAGLTYGE